MVQIIQASDLSLHQVKERFNLQQVWDDQFFWEWLGELPEINDYKRHWLDRVKDDFLSWAEYPLVATVLGIIIFISQFVLKNNCANLLNLLLSITRLSQVEDKCRENSYS
jgi:hypothetical protein